MRWTKRYLPSLALLLIAVEVLGGCVGGAADGRGSDQHSDAATRSTASAAAIPATRPTEASTFEVPIIELTGDGAAMGAEHGDKLRDSIHILHDQYLNHFIHGSLERIIALSAADAFRERLSSEHQAEVAALAAHAGVDARTVMLAQCFLDLTPMSACSTVALPADAAPDGVARFGRNLDFPSLDVADRYTALFICHPRGKYAFASVGWPGMVGVLSGMNEHGLTVANMEVKRSVRLPQAMPYTLLYRTLLEECRTTDEALALLARTPRQTSNNLMIMDAAGQRAVAEIAPEGVTVRRGAARLALISTNHRRGADQSTAGRCDRYDSLCAASAANYGAVDLPRLESMLADASQRTFTLQSMVFEPRNRVIYLSAGKDAARAPFHRLALGPYFGGSMAGR